jgi:hypothetical protein
MIHRQCSRIRIRPTEITRSALRFAAFPHAARQVQPSLLGLCDDSRPNIDSVSKGALYIFDRDILGRGYFRWYRGYRSPSRCEDDLRSTARARHAHGGLYQDREDPLDAIPCHRIELTARNACSSSSFRAIPDTLDESRRVSSLS